MPEQYPKSHPWRRPLLAVEFTALAVLLGSMMLFPRLGEGGAPLSPALLLIPAIASLVVFLSFIGLMYLRWVANVEAEGALKHKLIFGLLTLTLLTIWAYGIAQTWQSVTG